MFITKRSLPRRTFLKGAGGMLALPLLEAMIPASTALAQTPATPTPRFVGIFFPHGMAPGHWEMAEGPLPEKLSTIMAAAGKSEGELRDPWRHVVALCRTAGRHNGLGSLGGRCLHDCEQAEEDDWIRLHSL